VSFIEKEFPFGKACARSPMVVSHQSHMDDHSPIVYGDDD